MPPRTNSRLADSAPASHTANAAQDSSALARGLAILDCLLRAGRPLTLVEVAQATQLPSSTAHRQLLLLEQLGRSYRDAAGRHCAGAATLAPLPLNHPLNLLRRDATDVLRQLQSRFSATAVLTVFLGQQRLVIEAITGQHAIAPYIGTQVHAPLHCSVSGKLLLSTLVPAARDQLLGPAPYLARTATSITQRAALFNELDRIAADKRAVNLEENVEGICAQGVLVATAAGQAIGALALTGPSAMFCEAQRAAMLPVLTRNANMLGASLSAHSVAGLLAA